MELSNTEGEEPESRSASFSIACASDAIENEPPQQPPEKTIKSIKELHSWLQPTDYLSPGNEYMKHLAAYVPGTGDWLRKTDQFCHWSDVSRRENHHNKCWWIKGVPGTGKSVFAASVAQSLHRFGAPVLFFFFRQIVNTNHTPTYLVRDWCAQLLPHSLAFQRELNDLSGRDPGGIEMTLLWDALCRALKGMQTVYCIADGLDEMDESHWDNFLPLLKSLAVGRRGVKLLLTSRPIPRLESILQDPEITRIRIDPALIFPDIITYTNVRLLALPQNAKLRTETEDKVRDAICGRANGLFLHARIMIDNLTTGLLEGTITDATLPESLEKLPRNLQELYTSMLDEHSQRSGVTKEQQFKILTFVTSSSRPLRLIELASMVCWMRNEKPDDALKKYKELVRAACGRLLEILEDETVSVIHHSLTEFLRNENRSDMFFPIVRPVNSQKTLALLCLEYLSACSLPAEIVAAFDKNKKCAEAGENKDNNDNDGESEEVEEGTELASNTRQAAITTLRMVYPLLEYAVTNLVLHLRSSNPEQTLNADIAAVLDRLFVPGSVAFIIYLLRHWKSNAFTNVTALHVATSMPLEPYVAHLLASGADVDALDNGSRCALAIACSIPYDDTTVATRIARALLEAHASPDLPEREGKTPLHCAVQANRPGIVRLLLDIGVSPLTPRTDNDEYMIEHFNIETIGDTPLLYSTSREGGEERTEIMKMFLPHIAQDTNLLYKMLAWTTNTEIIQEVLELGKGRLDINSLLNGVPLLFPAAYQQNLQLVKILLQHGADPNACCESENSLFMGSNSEDVWVNPMREHGTGPTPLHAWAKYQYIPPERAADIPQVFQILVEAGADVNAKTAENSTPLHQAVKEDSEFRRPKNETRTRLLLNAGADPNVHNKYGRTPLHDIKPEWGGLVEAFVSKGADVNARDNQGDTPLQRLLDRSCMGWCGPGYWVDELLTVSHQLLKHGADVNTRNDSGYTVSHKMMGLLKDKSADRGNLLKLWNVFIDAGLDLNAQNQKVKTPFLLYQCGEYGKTEEDAVLFRALREAGMDLEGSLEEKTKMLFEIVHTFDYDPRKMIQRLKELVDQGYPATVRNQEQQTLLHVAIGNGQHSMFRKQMVQFLFDHGLDPAAVDSKGDTIMHVFARKGTHSDECKRELEVLLDHGVPISKRNRAGQLPLHVAVRWSHEGRSALGLFLNLPGVDPNAADAKGLTPMHYAADVSEYQVGQILKAGADPKVVTDEYLSPLYISCRARASNTVGLLLSEYKKQGVLQEWINQKDNINGRTPLHVAALSGQAESVRYLLEYGADVTALDTANCTALYYAAEVQEEATLLSHRSYADDDGIAVHDTHRHVFSQSSWHIEGIINSCSEMVEMLIAAGVDEKAMASRTSTALDHAVNIDNREMVERLAEMRESPAAQEGSTEEAIGNLDDLFKLPDSQILRILQSGKYDVTDWKIEENGVWRFPILHRLVDHGKIKLLTHFAADAHRMDKLASVFEESNPGTLLFHACERGLPSLHIIRTLVEDIGLDSNAKSDRRGSTYKGYKMGKATPLHRLAAGSNFWNIEAVAYLISKGADLEAMNYHGESPLAVAVSTEWPNGYWKRETAEVLLKAGADPNSLDNHWRSPLAKVSSSDLAQLLLDYGADIEIGEGRPLFYAIDTRNVEVVQILLEWGANPNGMFDGRYMLHHVARPSEDEDDLSEEEESEASITARRRLTELLVQYKADPFLRHEGSTVLHSIISEHGILEPFLELAGLPIETIGDGDRTLLISACVPTVPPHPDIICAPIASGSPAAALALIALGANVNARDEKGRSALHWLSTQPEDLDSAHQAVFNALVEKSPDLIHQVDDKGWSPYDLANAHLHTWTSDRLITLGVDASAPAPDGNTALHQFSVAMFGNKDRAKKAAARFKALVGLGLDINAKNTLGETPLFRFLSSRLSDLPRYVIESQDPKKSPWACDSDTDEEPCPYPRYSFQDGDFSHCASLSAFIDAGADLSTTNNQGETLLHATAARKAIGGGSNGNWNADSDQNNDVVEVFERLVAMGVDVSVEDRRCRTALDVAVACGHQEIVDTFGGKGLGVVKSCS